MVSSGVRRRRAVATFVVALATACGVVLGVSTPAYAWATDNVRITDPGIDFGGSVFTAGVPVGSGHLRWFFDLANWDLVTPNLQGHLHLNNVAGECGRMHMAAYDDDGDLIDLVHGGSVCAPDNGHHHWSVNLSTDSSERVHEVVVCTELQDNGGIWHTVTCQSEIKN